MNGAPMTETTDWRAELAAIEFDRLPAAARRLVLELAERFGREDAAGAEAAGCGGRVVFSSIVVEPSTPSGS